MSDKENDNSKDWSFDGVDEDKISKKQAEMDAPGLPLGRDPLRIDPESGRKKKDQDAQMSEDSTAYRYLKDYEGKSAEESPGGFWIRFVAVVLDFMMYSVISLVLTIALTVSGLNMTSTPELDRMKLELTTASESGVEDAQELTLILMRGGDTEKQQKMYGEILNSSGIAFIFYILYYCLPLTLMGGTFGKRLLGLRVRNRKSGKNLNFFFALLREIVFKPISAMIMFMGYLLALFNEEKRSLHDFLSGSVVVQGD